MAKTVASSFAFAVAAILTAFFFAPRSNANVEHPCSQAYGVNTCVAQAAASASNF
ncbi:hypothetical protein [Pararhizobium mangrovi]|uniref:hypothetical protein n=1 Tax=Pararhizobium mangrovi TaxID=2590452 RepID=UPI0015E86B07|nr:hypothetical protein [Pararhizobium mangrovi]